MKSNAMKSHRGGYPVPLIPASFTTGIQHADVNYRTESVVVSFSQRHHHF